MCITKSISSQFRSNRPTRSLAMSNSNFLLTDFTRNAQSNSSSLSSPLQLNADFHWVADTGATSHMTPHCHWFKSYTHCRTPIRLVNNIVVYSAGVGNVIFFFAFFCSKIYNVVLDRSPWQTIQQVAYMGLKDQNVLSQARDTISIKEEI